MTYTSRSMFTVPLTSKAYKLAKTYQNQYENLEKARQVYLNILAVYAVDTYCQCLGIETDLEASESLNPVTQTLMNIGDLEIAEIGKIECRPVLPEDEYCYIPTDTWENRIGYIAVEINDSSREATLLGFYPPVNPLEMMEQISLDDFQALETLLDHLERLKSAIDFFQDNEDDVVEKIMNKLDAESFSEILVQLEPIYRLHREEWRYAGADFLANYLPTNAKESVAFRGDTASLEKAENEEIKQQNELQDLAEELLEKLAEIWNETAAVNPETATATVRQNQPILTTIIPIPGMLSLSEWLQNPESSSQANWQTLESFLSSKQGNLIFRFASAPRSRSAESETSTLSVTKVREIVLGNHPVALIVNCQLERDGIRNILLRLYPTTEAQTYLPPEAQLIILDESGEVFLEAISRSADNWMQLEFSGEVGERFSVKVTLGDACVTEEFVI